MRFKNIKEFIELVPNCEFCGNRLNLTLKSKRYLNTNQTYNMTFTGTTFDPVGTLNFLFSKDSSQVTYDSDQTDEHLNFYYQINGRKTRILFINKITNVVGGSERDWIQNVFWDHHLALALRCCTDTCALNKTNHFIESATLTFERKNRRICPPLLESEGVIVPLNGSYYGIVSSYDGNMSAVMGKSQLIKKIPLIPLYNIKDKQAIINKVKTLLIFS
jgi:hypothetical protein